MQIIPSSDYYVLYFLSILQKNTTKNKLSPVSDSVTVQPPVQYLTNSLKLSSTQIDVPPILRLEAEQQSAVVLLTSHIYTLASIIALQMSSIDR